MRIISEQEVSDNLKLEELIEKIEEVYKDLSDGKIVIPPRFFSLTKDGGDILYGACTNLGTCRFVVRSSSYSPWLSKQNKPVVNANYIISSFEDGIPLGVIQGTNIVNLRTAAKTAVAVRKLAKTSSKILGMIGFGASGHMDALAVTKVLDLEKILVYVREPEKWEVNKKKVQDLSGVNVEFCSLERVKQDSDVIVLATWSDEPLIQFSELTEGQLVVSTAHKA